MANGLIALQAPVGRAEWLRGARRARRLATLFLAWLCFEGAATTRVGLLAGSIALVGNGLDGAIEGLASVIGFSVGVGGARCAVRCLGDRLMLLRRSSHRDATRANWCWA